MAGERQIPVGEALARELYVEEAGEHDPAWEVLDEAQKVPWLHRVGAGPLGFPKAGHAYRRSVRQKPYRVIWREDGRDRSKAFHAPTDACLDTVRWVRGKSELPVLIIQVERGWVFDTAPGMRPRHDDRRAPTEAERERILAMKLTYDPR